MMRQTQPASSLIKQRFFAVAFAIFGTATAGCAGSRTHTITESGTPRSSAELAPAIQASLESAIVGAHNDRIELLDAVWLSAEVTARIKDSARNSYTNETFDGHFIYKSPRFLALTLGKLSRTQFLYGGDRDHFWLINAEDSIAHICRHDNFSHERKDDSEFIVPQHFILLSAGLLPIAHPERYKGDLPPMSANVAFSSDRNLVEYTWVAHLLGDEEYRYQIAYDTADLLPRSVRITDLPNHLHSVVSHLDDYRAPTFVRADWEKKLLIPHKIRVELHYKGALEVELSIRVRAGGTRPSESPSIQDGIFDFSSLLRLHRITNVNVLDRECERPAWMPTGGMLPYETDIIPF